MKKEIAPELYNYNKFPGPQFAVFAGHVKSGDIDLLILEDVKNGFDATVFSQRFSDILLKYDYIVGDWGNEQLRLKGFYKETNKKKYKASYINCLEDYLKEYCNFGCAYFVLENPEPKEIKNEEESVQKNKQRDSHKKKKFRKNEKMHLRDKRQHEKDQERKQLQEIRNSKHHFVICKKEQ
ncbi:YutD family protein [Streptococcus macacae]|uniref:PF06265 family protein n=1 Tax=Streptococcus macacae NCTC 11558 TaxID=764298 RepID=G5JWQ5_9STRE|nr:YutD-like domain-containing protein [Streptococcus macacae]EHJ53163.1 hypothetical protein STRMA_1191 [Streptococcus macacae NCTC 11558]SUN79015.1 putative transcriptional regulator [Streptococcus macacae NCTC 11558]